MSANPIGTTQPRPSSFSCVSIFCASSSIFLNGWLSYCGGSRNGRRSLWIHVNTDREEAEMECVGLTIYCRRASMTPHGTLGSVSSSWSGWLRRSGRIARMFVSGCIFPQAHILIPHVYWARTSQRSGKLGSLISWLRWFLGRSTTISQVCVGFTTEAVKTNSKSDHLDDL